MANNLDLEGVEKYVNEHIDSFHNQRLILLTTLDFSKLLKSKNPYLFKAKNMLLAQEFIEEVLNARLAASEEGAFGGFLEDLAIYVSEMMKGGWKSGITGIDLEFKEGNRHCIVSVKSGPNWGNEGQQTQQQKDFEKAIKTIGQSSHDIEVYPVLGICYGKTKTNYVRGANKIVGQNFWHFISGSPTLYQDIVVPLGYEAKKHNDAFLKGKAKIVNKFTQEFMEAFCTDGQIDWPKVVEFNSGNMRHPEPTEVPETEPLPKKLRSRA